MLLRTHELRPVRHLLHRNVLGTYSSLLALLLLLLLLLQSSARAL